MDDTNIGLNSPILSTTLTAADNGLRIGVLTLNVEKSLNALSLEMIDILTAQLKSWSTDDSIAMVMMQAVGDKAFCAGGDLQNLYQSMLKHHASAEKNDIAANQYACDFFGREYRLDYFIHTYPKPILCWGNGFVIGGGIGLMAGASHRVVTEKSRLSMPEIAIGLFPDVAGNYFLNRMPGKLGLFLALTGATMNAADAKFAKLADYAILQADKEKVIEQLLSQPWGTSKDENSQMLDAVLSSSEMTPALDKGPLQTHIDTINALCNHDSLLQIIDAMSALDTEEPWLKKAISSLKKGSPTSAFFTDFLLNQAVGMSLPDVLRMEFIAAVRCAARPDFLEGIRALLIDKDLQPKWQPATHAEMAMEQGSSFIESPWSVEMHPLVDLGKNH